MPLEIVELHVGEMDSEELKVTTMDPATRTLKQITMKNKDSADKIFNDLMGIPVPPRKQFIIENSHFARIDI